MRDYRFRAWDKRFNTMRYGNPMSIFYLNNSDHELMQYTGLHDKNGKEIYEGDIVKVNGWNGKNIIKYYKEWAGFGLDGSDWKMSYIHTPFEDSRKGFNVEYEVIGNIYDNPELLKDKTGQI